jgi:hypothetical protein
MPTYYMQNNVSEKSARDYVNMCRTVNMFNADTIFSDSNESVNNGSTIIQLS